jgi:hypothetical protein
MDLGLVTLGTMGVLKGHCKYSHQGFVWTHLTAPMLSINQHLQLLQSTI